MIWMTRFDFLLEFLRRILLGIPSNTETRREILRIFVNKISCDSIGDAEDDDDDNDDDDDEDDEDDDNDDNDVLGADKVSIIELHRGQVFDNQRTEFHESGLIQS